MTELRIPVAIITGFLGSGKTTLVNHILAEPHGRRIALLINEFGDVDIDQSLVICAERDLVSLSNGCICCSMSDGLITALQRLLERRSDFDYLVIETTGIADPAPVAMALLRPEFAALLRLDAIITLADAEHFAVELFEDPSTRNQIRYADVVLLNKCDVVGSPRIEAVEDQIRSLNPQARIVRTKQSRVAIPLIAGIGGSAFAGNRPRDAIASDHAFRSVSFSTAAPLDPDRFQSVLEEMPAGVFRAKGFLLLAGVQPVHVFHLVARRFTLEEAPGAARSTQLVFIGTDFDREALLGRLRACETTDATPA